MNTNTNTNTPKTDVVPEALVSLGRDWATYGLKMAKLALEQSAGTLGKVAEALVGLRAQVERTGATPEARAPEAGPGSTSSTPSQAP